MSFDLSTSVSTSGIQNMTTHQILELDVEVFLDGESGVGDSFVQVRVQITDHL